MHWLNVLPEKNFSLIMDKMKKSEDGTVVKYSQKKQQIAGIQGLRGLSILAVLLFHIREDTFKVGYLGVDIFFVISGYLMCKILSKQAPLDHIKFIDFYHRRIKRIVPVYIFVIFLTLFMAITVFMYPLDYNALYKETLRPLLYAANIPDVDDEDYFVQSLGGYHFFRHLWSLSAEIQFYLIAPLLMFALGFFVPIVRVVLVILIAFISYQKQSNSSGNEEHMSMTSRIWQFMVGFLAHYLSESRFLQFDEWIKEYSRPKNQMITLLRNSLSSIFTLFLFIFVSVQVFHDKQFNRLILMCITLLVVAKPDPNIFLGNWILVELGNISYSVYMIHWPLFEWHKYWDIGAYAYGRHAAWTIAIILIVASIVLGYILENFAVKFTKKFINSGKSLCIVVFGLYALIFLCLRHMNLNASNEQLVLSRIPSPLRDPLRVEQELMTVWMTRNSANELRPSTSLRFNKNFQQLSWDLPLCPNRLQTAIPTSYDLRKIGFGSMFNKIGITASCVQQGNGSKNIVVLGNSHAQAYYYGIERHFRGIYRHLTMFSAGGCFLIRMEERRQDLTPEKYAACLRFRDDLFDILSSWQHQIDLIIVGHGYLYPTDPPIIVKDITKDRHFIELQSLFSGLGRIANELVLVSKVQFETGLNPHMGILQRKILYGEDVDLFRLPYELQERVRVNLKKRISLVNCPKCVHVDFEDVFCNKEAGYCDSVEPKRKLSYFFDVNHVNAYGSMLVGEYMRKLYDKWLVDSQKLNGLNKAKEIEQLLKNQLKAVNAMKKFDSLINN